MKEPRPAMISARPPESRSSVAKSWKTRTGSSELSTETALVRRIRSVRSAPAASATAGAGAAKAGRGWSPAPEAEAAEPTRAGQLVLRDEVAQPPLGRDDRAAARLGGELREGVDAEFH